MTNKPTINHTHNYRAVSLFSGVGGDTLGMTQAGCKVIGYNEINPNFCKSHNLNFTDCELISNDKITDISKLTDETFDKFKGKTDILFAGVSLTLI
jgi:site-specific DNA-cytosine methylase